MRYLTLGEVVELHRRVLQVGEGAPGIRDLSSLDSAIAQPKTTFGGVDLYPTVVEKAAALCFSLVQDHPFVDGNKRVGHAAMETFLVLNGTEIDADVDEQERLMLDLAAGRIDRAHLTERTSCDEPAGLALGPDAHDRARDRSSRPRPRLARGFIQLRSRARYAGRGVRSRAPGSV